ncbi:MAG TPA: DHA2 family efflux MFS transporter permease subunit [Candidatus Methanoperedens sp.]|nr:DHA2 family efflux MFS transporter permease subunit [Candidatus Methanoperedens sp.]
MGPFQRPASKWLIAFTVMLPTLIEIIDTSIVNVSLDHIRGSLSAGIEEATWAINAYLVANAIVIPMSGWLSRLCGRKNYQIGSIVVFTVSSFLCGSAWDLQSLIFFRVLQGLAGGGLVPVSQSILLEAFPPQQHGMAMAIFGIGAMVGPILGPIMGGWITDNWSWRWIFYINIPLGALAIAMNAIVIQDPPWMQRLRMRIDYFGLVFLAVGLGALQIVLDRGQQEDWFSSETIVAFALISVFALAFLVVNEMTDAHPIINLRLFRDRTFATGSLVMFFLFFNLFGSIVLLPIYVQSLMGYSSYDAGLVLGPGGAATLLVMPVVGKLVQKVNPKKILACGIVVSAWTTWTMAHFNLQADFWTFVLPRVTLGIGMGLSFIPLTTLTLSHIPRELMGQATSMYNLLRNMGGSVGIAFVTTFLARRAQFHQSRLVEHLTPFDPAYALAQAQTAAAVAARGAEATGTDALIYGQMLRQARALAFNDTFTVTAVLLLSVLVLVFFMRRAEAPARP